MNLELINKMRAIFISINDYLSSSGEEAQDFSELAEIKWLPAAGDDKTLYKPSSLFTQYKGQNTRSYLLYLDNILYLDVTDKHLLKANLNPNFINILGLKNIGKIPTAVIIDNIEEASNKNKPLKNHIGIYKEINTRIDKSNNSWVQDIDRLNNFPSIYIYYTKDNSFSYFEPSKVFRNGYAKLYGNEYISYLSPNFVVHCEKLLNHLKVSEEPNCQAIKRILEDISNKYERSDNKILSKEDKKS